MEKLVVSGSYLLLFVALASFSLLNNKAARSEQIITSETPFQTRPAVEEEIKKEKVMPVNETDTIPKNASKEFIAGYNAGKNYKNEASPAATDSVKMKIEQRVLQKKITEMQQADLTYPTTVITMDAREKKRVEEAMIASKKANQ